METQLKTVENAEMFNLHEPTEALPDQIKKNKSIVGRISLINNPTGPSGPFGIDKSTQFEVTIQNAQQLDLKNTFIEGDVVLTKNTAGKYASYVGAHTAFSGITIELDGKKIVDIQTNADRIADYNLYTSKTKDELDYMESLMGCNVNMKNNDVITFRVPLSLFGCSISTLLPTGSINSTLRLRFNVNDKPLNQLFKGTSGTGENGANDAAPGTGCELEYNNMRVVADYYELQPLVLNKMLDLIQSSNGLTIPYHAYYADNRTIQKIPTLNERIAMSYNNIVSIAQLPYKNGRTGEEDPVIPFDANYYRTLKWNDETTNDIKQYLVNFEGSQYFNIGSNWHRSIPIRSVRAKPRIVRSRVETR